MTSPPSSARGAWEQVYQATDTKLNRQVALKILPEAFATDPDRLARFQREAQVLASLNHPNIAQIHGIEEADGTRALVLELVEGPTLADRIAQGAIPVDEALPIAKQIAEALEAAHEQGVIHRDLKPANVKVRADGTVKVLDFGLAKALDPTPTGDPSQSPTVTGTVGGTREGIILGTAAYMSPEQARGKTLDRRTDIWSFGCVLYEMFTGQAAFLGETLSDTIAKVLDHEPDWQALPTQTPVLVRRLLRRCLDKDPKDRLRDIGDARVELREAVTGPLTGDVAAVPVAPQPAGWRQALPWVVGIVLALITGVAVWTLTPRPARPPARFMVGTPATEPFTPARSRQDLAVSRDGRHIVYRSVVDGVVGLYVRPVDRLDGTRLFVAPQPGLDVSTPVISPDGARVAFMSQADETWKSVSILGGSPLTLFPNPIGTFPRGASWGADNTIIFAHASTGLWRGPAGGGEPEVLTTPDAAQGETAHRWPEILPGGEAVLFTIVKRTGIENQEIAVLDLVTGEQEVLIPGGSSPRYAPTGHIVYGVDTTLQAVPFDLDRLEVTGNPVPVLEGVMISGGSVQFSFSADGALVYGTGEALGVAALRTLVWVDRDGREEPLTAEPRAYLYPRISPDGTKVALAMRDQELDIWIWDLTRETLTRLTFDPAQDIYPVWTPDGQRVAFSSARAGSFNLFWTAADGTGAVERLTEAPNNQFARAFSPDGTRLVFHEAHPDTARDLRVLLLDGERRSEPLLANEFDEQNPELSPDGRWLAYQSDASGQEEIYVRPFPTVDEGRWQISTRGGTRPLWAPDGRELFYLAPGGDVMAVPIQTEPTLTAGNGAVLVEGPAVVPTAPGRLYDMAPDGQRFLMIKEGVATESGTPPQIILVQNWFEELKRLVPVP